MTENNDTVLKNDEISNWDDLEVGEDLLRGIYNYGFEKPSPIQQKAILPIIQCRDLVAQAQTGTGKTAKFAIGALSRIDLSLFKTQVLILSPTQELTVQTANVIKSLGTMMKGLSVETLFGGIEQPKEQRNSFMSREKAHIVCGCPGKVMDNVKRNYLSTGNIKLVILDEADEMLSGGFNDQIYDIFRELNEDVQIALFSATMPSEMGEIVSKMLRDPVKILVKNEMLTLEGIQQFYIALDNDEQKYDVLKDLYSYLSVSQCIIYCNSVRRVCDLYEAMRADNFPVTCLHRNMTKEERNNAFTDFKTGNSRVLISTNVTARGIDIQQVSVVINFDIPTSIEMYLHRIGRSGRWGRKGVGINFVTRRDVDQLRRIETHYNSQINEMPGELGFLNKF